MKRSILIGALTLLLQGLHAENVFDCKLLNKEADIELVINLYDATVLVPDMEMFGGMNGYMRGKGIYNTWVVTSCKVKNEQEASLTFSNDLGSETQKATLRLEADSCYHLREVDGAVFKKVGANRKLLKLPDELIFNKVKER
jgi:hypothetical protein